MRCFSAGVVRAKEAQTGPGLAQFGARARVCGLINQETGLGVLTAAAEFR
ncbi:MAG: hypothetical protein ACYDHP_10455 [Ferrimicrobium sp.]